MCMRAVLMVVVCRPITVLSRVLPMGKHRSNVTAGLVRVSTGIPRVPLHRRNRLLHRRVSPMLSTCPLSPVRPTAPFVSTIATRRCFVPRHLHFRYLVLRHPVHLLRHPVHPCHHPVHHPVHICHQPVRIHHLRVISMMRQEVNLPARYPFVLPYRVMPQVLVRRNRLSYRTSLLPQQVS